MIRTPIISETLAETQQVISTRSVPQRRRILTGLTAGAVALSIILGSVAPARADDKRDLIKALAAIAVIGVIAHEVGKDRDAKPVEHRHDGRPADRWDDRRDDWRPSYPARPQPQQRARIPGACAIEIEGRNHRNVIVYAESCLRKNGIGRLPRSCARDVRFYGRTDRVYAQGCLRDAGYRFGHNPRRDR